MTHIVFLCAMMGGGFTCLPFGTMSDCRSAEAALSLQLVEASDCTAAELRAGTEYAPEWSPLPPVKP